jgi:hypothetical protein
MFEHRRETMTLNFETAIQELDQEIAKLQRVRSVLVEYGQNGTVPRGESRITASAFLDRKRKRHMSAASRARIAAAQRARWAKWHKEKR